MVNYNNGKIYKIIDNTNGNIYIGSTTKQYLSQRLASHVSDYKSFLNNKYHFVTSFTIIENNDYSIELIELYPCSCRDELHAREGYHIRNNICVNRIIVGRTDKEYRKDNKDKIREYHEANRDKIREYKKVYREDNKDKIREQKRDYHEANKETIKDQKKAYREANKEANKEREKAYREANRDKIKEREKAYREANREKLREQKKAYYEKQKNKDLDNTIL